MIYDIDSPALRSASRNTQLWNSVQVHFVPQGCMTCKKIAGTSQTYFAVYYKGVESALHRVQYGSVTLRQELVSPSGCNTVDICGYDTYAAPVLCHQPFKRHAWAHGFVCTCYPRQAIASQVNKVGQLYGFVMTQKSLTKNALPQSSMSCSRQP